MNYATATRYYPPFENILLLLLPPSIRKLQRDHFKQAIDKIHRRMNLEEQREDFMTPVLQNNPNYDKMSLGEIESTFSMIIIAGSETTATILSGLTNELTQNPVEYEKLVREIRSSFTSDSDMTFAALKALPFLNAVCSESLRLCNPVPTGLPRVVPPGGASVCGHFLPENVTNQPPAPPNPQNTQRIQTAKPPPPPP